MIKTSVYLPEALKDELAQLARREGVSEAELIRAAIEGVVQDGRVVPRPTALRNLPGGPCVIGVGVGPGDPALVTEEARCTLQAVDRIVVISSGPDVVGRAEMVVRAVLPGARVERLPIDVYGSSRRTPPDYRDAAAMILTSIARKERIAVAVLGDPNIFSVFAGIANAVRSLAGEDGLPTPEVRTVSGVMPFQQLAAHAGVVLAQGDETLVVLPAGDNPEQFDAAVAQADATVAVCKSGRQVPNLVESLRQSNRLDDAVIGELLGLPGGRSGALAEQGGGAASYLATVLIPAKRKPA